MKININNLRVGSIIAEDVMGLTNYPIIPKNTKVNPIHIDVLKAFFKTEVIVKDDVASENEENKVKDKDMENPPILEDKASGSIYYDSYIETVNKYKVDFQSWQAGAPLDVTKIRDYFYKLFEKTEKENIDIQLLQHYSNQVDYVYNHSITVGLISGLIAKKMGYSKGQYYQTALAGCLANVGMSKIPSKIITKTSFLSNEEHQEMKNHPNYSLKMVQNSSLLKQETKLAILQHHERLDGSGYPMGVKDKQVYPMSRIIAVADVYHALVSERLYKENTASFKALEIMRIDGFGQFDISVINTLTKLVANLSIGTKVKLSDGSIGEVIFTKQVSLTRPLIKLENGEVIDLEKKRDIHIEAIF